jgi:hypothetical protein
MNEHEHSLHDSNKENKPTETSSGGSEYDSLRLIETTYPCLMNQKPTRSASHPNVSNIVLSNTTVLISRY